MVIRVLEVTRKYKPYPAPAHIQELCEVLVLDYCIIQYFQQKNTFVRYVKARETGPSTRRQDLYLLAVFSDISGDFLGIAVLWQDRWKEASVTS